MEQQQPMEQRPTRQEPRPGRTIYVISETDYTKESFNGVNTITEGRTPNSKFIVFDTIENAKIAYGTLMADKVRANYQKYQLFLKFKNLNKNDTYDTIKETTITKMKEFDTDSNVTTFQLKRRHDQFAGWGDCSVDTKEAQDKLLSAKQLELGEGVEATFTRFMRPRRGPPGGRPYEQRRQQYQQQKSIPQANEPED